MIFFEEKDYSGGSNKLNKEGIESGKERMAKDALARYLGIELKELKPGYARAVMEVKSEHLNGVGLTHGGAIFSLADLVFAAASNSHGRVALGLNVNINYLKATKLGEKLVAEATEVHLTTKTGVYRMEIKDSKGEKVAVAEGLVYRKSSY